MKLSDKLTIELMATPDPRACTKLARRKSRKIARKARIQQEREHRATFELRARKEVQA